ncbi:allantoate amidohydrolase [Burkholderiaceae bacterium FT117]|uniref:allantoate amidohydrolase n=1 Tax=Zeimonas sediminis TaxID=2944268 RepID=UPI002342FFCF|nr:allantoate amidohydrolase [Zeimonas sediminis]MCM5570589.1 allantoate amidohydrolase [Zeimonas sediminis]
MNVTPTSPESLGARILEMAEALARHSDQPDGLTVSYLGAAHRAAARDLAGWMREAGMEAEIDALGNVVGRYAGAAPDAPVLMTGSHFDTVRNGGKYDGRLGILLPIAVVAALHARGERLGCAIEIVGFAEEEGLRFRTSFLSSSAIAGAFDMGVLDRTDADGISLRDAIRAAGLPGTEASIQALARDRGRPAGYIEVHIEQGPVLLERGLPVGIVTSIAGSVRMTATVTGVAGHAGTTPMTMRKDAAAAAAEMVLAVERRCSQAPTLVGTVGMLSVPNGSANVVPGRCDFSLDVRAADDATRDAAVADVVRECRAIAERRGVTLDLATTMQVPCAPCAPRLADLLEACVARAGVAPFRLPSGAGHDAMMIARLTDVCMLFVRCGNGGISHNPLETMTAADAGVAAEVFLDFVRRFETS